MDDGADRHCEGEVRINGLISRTLALGIAAAAALMGVDTQINEGVAPVALAPGAPAGSYRLSDFESLNLYGGKVNVTIPLLQIGGRGTPAYTAQATVENYSWYGDMQTNYAPYDGSSCFQNVGCYYQYASARWRTSSPGYRAFYGPGMVIAKYSGVDPLVCPGGTFTVMQQTFTHFVFLAPDGSEIDLLPSDKSPTGSNRCTDSQNLQRGPMFHSHGGSNIWFVNQYALYDGTDPNAFSAGPSYSPYAANGTLYFPDGRKYAVSQGLVQQIVDRNGNTTNFTYASRTSGGNNYGSIYVSMITDPTGRRYNIDYLITDEPGCVGSAVQCDRIRYTGENGAAEKIVIHYQQLVTILRSDITPQGRLFPNLGGEEGINQEFLLSAITLPNGNQWQIFYDAYGEVAKVVTPAGGAVEYDFGAGLNANGRSGVYPTGQVLDDPNGYVTTDARPSWRPFIYRRLSARREYNSAVPNEGYQKRTETPWKTTSYPQFERVQTANTTAGKVSSLVIQSDGALTESGAAFQGANTQAKHKYFDEQTVYSPATTLQTQSTYDNVLQPYPNEFDGKEYRTELGVGDVPLRTIDRAWGLEESGDAALPCQQNTTYQDPGGAITSSALWLYDRNLGQGQVAIASPLGAAGAFTFGNLSDSYEYGFDSSVAMNTANGLPACQTGVPAGWSRRTHRDYTTSPAYFSSSLFLPSLRNEERVYDPINVVSDQTYSYDTNAIPTGAPYNGFYSDAANAALCSTSATGPRGNLSLVTTNLYDTLSHAGLGATTEQLYYDCVGNMRLHSDPKGIQTSYSYSDSFFSGSPSGPTYAYLTAAALPNGAQISRMYDFNTGQVRQETDPNQLVTQYSFADTLNRLKTVTRGMGAGGTIQSTTTFTYNDVPASGNMPTSVQTVRPQFTSADSRLNSSVVYDAFGRVVKSQVNGTDTVFTSTAYDGNGLVQQSCNPQKSSGGSVTDGCTMFSYDSLGRISVTHAPDGSASSTTYSIQASAPRARVETAQDPAGITRKAMYDGLGRLLSVQAGSPVYTTTYTYDVLDNLVSVAMPAQTRSFRYDSLKRLLSATNPESGTTTYGYDANGNLVRKADARGVVTCYGNLSGTNCDGTGYDSLNRPVKITYSDGTPTSVFCYDGASYVAGSCGSAAGGEKMRRTGEGNAVSATNFGYDQAGRLISSAQTTAGGASSGYPFSYSYFVDDSVASVTMPSQHVYSTCYDANQRATWVSAVHTSTDCINGVSGSGMLAQVNGYTPVGGALSVTYGNGMLETNNYNNRTQLLSRQTVTGGVTRLMLSIYYCPSQQLSCSTNNGNVRSQAMSFGAGASESVFSALQSYGYDGDNRLTSVAEGSATQTYGYDVPGNRWVASNAGFPNLNPLTPTSSGAIDSTTNRLNGVGYDSAGNQTTLSPFALTYDAESRMVSAAGGSFGSGTYGYDAEGRRVTRVADGVSTVFVYDGFGQLAAEYGGPAPTVSGTEYLTQDHLGSTRLVTDAGGNVVKRYDYLPFGEALNAGANGRTSPFYSVGSYPYGADGQEVKFTGQLRDSETGLDYFGARYFHGALGRFTSADEPLTDQRAADPQSWNLYTYVRNNPLRYTDAFGRECQDPNGTDPCFDVTVHANWFVRFFSKAGAFLRGTAEEATVNTFLGTVNTIGAMQRAVYGGPNVTQPLVSASNSAEQYGQYAGMIVPFLIPGFGEADSIKILTEVDRLSIEAPRVTNPKLAELVAELFQGTDKVPGGTAGAVRYERLTGDLLSPAGHAQDARELIIRLDRFLKNNPGISVNDQAVAKGLILDLQKALGGK